MVGFSVGCLYGFRTSAPPNFSVPSNRTKHVVITADRNRRALVALGLPDIQGLEFSRLIHSRNERVPIVVLSSPNDEVGKVHALDLDAGDYVTKPFGMDELLARMRAAFRHQLQVQGERPIFRTGDLAGRRGAVLAADIVSVKGETRSERSISREILWKWIDAHGKEYGIGRTLSR
jgi:DNA-binding response OmpR family regulator